MSDAATRAQHLYRTIRMVLMDEWDPIGVSGIPEAADEYDGYVPTIYKLLIRRAPVHEVFDYLWRVETEDMGLCGSRQATESVATHLVDLPNEASGGSRAMRPTYHPPDP